MRTCKNALDGGFVRPGGAYEDRPQGDEERVGEGDPKVDEEVEAWRAKFGHNIADYAAMSTPDTAHRRSTKTQHSHCHSTVTVTTVGHNIADDAAMSIATKTIAEKSMCLDARLFTSRVSRKPVKIKPKSRIEYRARRLRW